MRPDSLILCWCGHIVASFGRETEEEYTRDVAYLEVGAQQGCAKALCSPRRASSEKIPGGVESPAGTLSASCRSLPSRTMPSDLPSPDGS